MTISNDKVVHMHYELTNDKGDVIDSSAGREPLAYLHGKGNIIPGLEKQLLDKKVGDKFKATVQPEEGYGVKDDSRIFKVTKSQFQGEGDVTVGLQIQLEANGQQMVGIVTEVDGENVTLDLNHPLAGETLHFDVEIMEIRDASADELSHGHVHGPGGAH